MTVYVDDAQRLAMLRHGSHELHARWSRLVADTSAELRAFGTQLGLSPSWLQLVDTPLEHFDVTASKRAAALARGALEITVAEREALEQAKRANVPFDLDQLRHDPANFRARLAPPQPVVAGLRRIQAAPADLPAGAVHVGPGTPWANPFRPARRGTAARQAAVDHFRRYLSRNPGLVTQARAQLHAKDLACTCPLHQPCHADVWLALANEEGPTP